MKAIYRKSFVLFENGELILPNGEKILPTGEVILTDGNIFVTGNKGETINYFDYHYALSAIGEVFDCDSPNRAAAERIRREYLKKQESMPF